ncbi:hypothetical protein [Candidatus Mesenet endosymbiont of Agriotes lineatus]|uniref:hypothetical protein n=1 Tax=Candidatus Mesenet endosymbiont of Agriotes lineatus TaxID=3077948 RepID=UPI0030D05291
MGHTILNFCNYGANDLRVNVFMKQCPEQVMWIRGPDIKQLIECIRYHSIGPYNSKKLRAAFHDYLNTQARLSRREKMEYKKEQDLYQCLVSREMYSTSGEYSVPGMQECFDQYHQPIKNTQKNLKPLALSSNLNHSRPSLHLNQANNSSTVFVAFIMFVFFVVMMLFCKCANKLLHRNENADRDLPMNQLGNKKTRRRSSIKDTESLCLKLVSCVGSCEQNYKKGY